MLDATFAGLGRGAGNCPMELLLGFLRNYAEYLDLDQEDLVVQFQQERGLIAEPARAFEPMRPIARRSVILTPAVFIPVLVLAGIALFVGYLYYQFTSFAVAPVLEVTNPSTDAIARNYKKEKLDALKSIEREINETEKREEYD